VGVLATTLRWRVVVGVLLIGAAAASFFAVRTLTDNGSSARADPPNPFEDSNWFQAAFDEDLARPQLERRVVNGITVGPEIELSPTSGLCQEVGVQPQYIPSELIEERSMGGPLEIAPSYLPSGVESAGAEGSECSGTVVAVAKYYEVPSLDNPADPRFLLWAGGSFSISRRLSTSPQHELHGAHERVGAIDVASHPAVLMRPVIPLGVDAGIGSFALVISDPNGVVTALEGNGLPLSEFLTIAESLYTQSR